MSCHGGTHALGSSLSSSFSGLVGHGCCRGRELSPGGRRALAIGGSGKMGAPAPHSCSPSGAWGRGVGGTGGRRGEEGVPTCSGPKPHKSLICLCLTGPGHGLICWCPLPDGECLGWRLQWVMRQAVSAGVPVREGPDHLPSLHSRGEHNSLSWLHSKQLPAAHALEDPGVAEDLWAPTLRRLK